MTVLWKPARCIDYIEYLADILTVGDLEERVAVVDELMKDEQDCFPSRTMWHGNERRWLSPWGRNGKMPDMNLPIWFDGQNINEALFCEEFLRERRIIFANGAFFTPDGRVTDDLPLRG